MPSNTNINRAYDNLDDEMNFDFIVFLFYRVIYMFLV